MSGKSFIYPNYFKNFSPLTHRICAFKSDLRVKHCICCFFFFSFFSFASSLEKRVKEIVHKAFWDCLSVQLSEDPPTYDHAIKLVGEIKEVSKNYGAFLVW